MGAFVAGVVIGAAMVLAWNHRAVVRPAIEEAWDTMVKKWKAWRKSRA